MFRSVCLLLAHTEPVLFALQMAEQREGGQSSGSTAGDESAQNTTEGEARDATEEEKKKEN